MFKPTVSVQIIPQLKDNYSYIIKDNNTNNIIIVDPAESKVLLRYIKEKQLKLKAILLTHHHYDHTAGVKNILQLINVPVYSPSKKIFGTNLVVKENDNIKIDFINFKVIATPGHTLDHIVYYNKKNAILFSGDTLFRLGCGRVFEGTYQDMYRCLKKLKKLNDDTMVFCGHEYTINNLTFLKSVFPKFKNLNEVEKEINNQLKNSNSSMPFNLGKEKGINPFLSSEASYFKKFKKNKDLDDLEMFSYLRKLKDDF